MEWASEKERNSRHKNEGTTEWRVGMVRRWGVAMLNTAPDKAADETTSFQCYPPVCLIIYRPTDRPTDQCSPHRGPSLSSCLYFSLFTCPLSSLYHFTLSLRGSSFAVLFRLEHPLWLSMPSSFLVLHLQVVVSYTITINAIVRNSFRHCWNCIFC